MSTRCANCSDADKAVAQARRERDILRAKLAEVERDLHSTEIENEAMTNRYVPLVEKYEATRSRVAALEHAGRLVIRECNCGDIEACSVCGPLDAALGTAAYAPGTFTMTMKEIPPEFSPIEPTLLDDEDAEKKGGRCERCGGKREWTDLLDGRKYPCPACREHFAKSEDAHTPDCGWHKDWHNCTCGKHGT